MQIVVLSDDRMPLRPDAIGGLSRSLWDLADGLAARGHAVTLVAARGSVFPRGQLITWGAGAMAIEADAWLDGSHAHLLSQARPDLPVLNRIGDLECAWKPPNVVVATEYMRGYFPNARIIKTGVKDEGVFNPTPGNHLLFMGGTIGRKGPEIARTVARTAGFELRAYGEGLAPLRGKEKWEVLSSALALLHPSLSDAAPRLPLEAATVGTPTVCLDITGAAEHVQHCVSGFICEDPVEMVEAVRDAALLDRRAIREWVLEEHAFDRMIDAYEAALASVADGERW